MNFFERKLVNRFLGLGQILHVQSDEQGAIFFFGNAQGGNVQGRNMQK